MSAVIDRPTEQKSPDTHLGVVRKKTVSLLSAALIAIAIELSGLGVGAASAAAPLKLFNSMQECLDWVYWEELKPWNFVTNTKFACYPYQAGTFGSYQRA